LYHTKISPFKEIVNYVYTSMATGLKMTQGSVATQPMSMTLVALISFSGRTNLMKNIEPLIRVRFTHAGKNLRQ